jgi:integrase
LAVSRNNAGRLDRIKATIRQPTVPHGNFILIGGAMQARYQYGNLTVRKRKKGPDVWQFRWMENGRLKSVLIGTIEKLPKQCDAERAVEHLRIKINTENPQRQFRAVTVGALIDRYTSEEMAGSVRQDTADSYRGILKNWIRPTWGSQTLESVKTMAVESWLKSVPRSRSTRAHIRNLMHRLFNCAIRWEMTDKNPVDLVRQSSKRTKIPRVLTAEEFKKLLSELVEPYKTMVLVAGCLGLRISEILGLRWGDIDWANLAVLVQRSVVHGKVYETKTEASLNPLPIDPELAKVLLLFRRQAVYVADTDYVFAGNSGKARWQGIMLTDHIKPAAARAGIGKVGWHTFRHTFSSILHNAGTNMAVQKELLRHADISTTMNMYTQAASSAKREGVHQVARVLLDGR